MREGAPHWSWGDEEENLTDPLEHPKFVATHGADTSTGAATAADAPPERMIVAARGKEDVSFLSIYFPTSRTLFTRSTPLTFSRETLFGVCILLQWQPLCIVPGICGTAAVSPSYQSPVCSSRPDQATPRICVSRHAMQMCRLMPAACPKFRHSACRRSP